MNLGFQISILCYLCVPLLLLCDRRTAPTSADWTQKVAHRETLLFPHRLKTDTKTELKGNQGRTKMNLLPSFLTDTWTLLLLFIVLLLV